MKKGPISYAKECMNHQFWFWPSQPWKNYYFFVPESIWLQGICLSAQLQVSMTVTLNALNHYGQNFLVFSKNCKTFLPSTTYGIEGSIYFYYCQLPKLWQLIKLLVHERWKLHQPRMGLFLVGQNNLLYTYSSCI